MTLELTLPPEMEARLKREAERQGLPVGAVTLKILNEHLPPADRRAAAIAMLYQWRKEDKAMTDAEAAANREILRAIDEDRLSDRKLFHDVLGDAPS